jgi:hypothetical protein
MDAVADVTAAAVVVATIHAHAKSESAKLKAEGFAVVLWYPRNLGC